MFVRSALARLAIAAAATALASAVAVTPATAGEERGGDGVGGDSSRLEFDPRHDSGSHHSSQNPRLYKGRVTASTLLLRSAPNRGSQVIGTAHRGQIVKIFCKTVGQNVDGNNRWYLLTNGTWAWASARYIDNIGPAPRWC
ncbi:SH3 domain-containing protein [Streptomyces broussonetiae]|uniref:SH3 domain-containing protein n=1 Tax=Streptomyces broussonetiae TaxID=2686304 RepID=A0ABV5E9F2_9ACTN